jgi:hypothetical protein
MNKIDQQMNRMKIETRLSHALLSNSHDFIRSAVKYANEDDKDSFKFAIIHLTSALELLLKSRLAEEHWSLIFINPDKATVPNLQIGNFISVDIDTAQKRLRNICNIELSNSDKELIKNLQKIRNKIIHFHIEINRNSIKGLTAHSLNTYIKFYNSNIAPNWEEYSVFGYELSQKLTEFKEFVESRMETLSSALNKSNRPKTNYFRECQYCLQDSIILNKENKLECLFCGDAVDIVDISEIISEDGSADICPSCGIKSYIVASIKNDQKNFECIICGHFEEKPHVWLDLNGNKLPHLRTFDN